MKLLCRNKEKAFTSLQALKEPGQIAIITENPYTLETVIRIAFPSSLNWNFGVNEITSAEQLTENEYKIIA